MGTEHVGMGMVALGRGICSTGSELLVAVCSPRSVLCLAAAVSVCQGPYLSGNMQQNLCPSTERFLYKSPDTSWQAW